MDKRKGDHRKEKLEGQIINYLFVKNYIKNGRYLCICECGNETIATTTELKQGLKKSCGCKRNKLLSESRKTHGDSYTRLYKIYKSIKNRCYGTYDKKHMKNYKDRGITMCDEWLNDWNLFKKWATENGYKENLTIDRINNNEGYSPNNCRWIPRKEQAANKRANVFITIGNETHTIAEWCRINNISNNAACKRIEAYGWNPIKAVTTPTRSYIKNGPYSRKNKASRVDGV